MPVERPGGGAIPAEMPGGLTLDMPGTVLGREGGGAADPGPCAPRALPGSEPGGAGMSAPGFEDGGPGTAAGDPMPSAVVLPRRAFRSIFGFFALSSAIGSSEAGQQVVIDAAIDGPDRRFRAAPGEGARPRSAHGREPHDRSAR